GFGKNNRAQSRPTRRGTLEPASPLDVVVLAAAAWTTRISRKPRVDALIFVLFQIGCATALALTALAAGLPAVRRLGCTSVAERVVWGFVLGLLAIAQTFLGLALARLFVPWTVGL